MSDSRDIPGGLPAVCIQNQEDVELAQAIVARDRKATARFVEMHADAVHRYVWRRLAPQVESADDLVQETFFAAWRSMGSYTGGSPIRSWLIGIARNKVEDHYRKTLSHRLQQLEEAGGAEPVAEVDLEAGVDDVRKAGRAAEILQKLPYEYATVLRWRYWDGSSTREMAAASGRTEKAVERLLARARAQFKELWLEQEEGGNPADGQTT